MSDLATTAPAFVDMAHRMVWATVATVASDGRPRSRILHPIWEWDGSSLTGWIVTDPRSPKRRDLDHIPKVALTYWDGTHDTCNAECDIDWIEDGPGLRALWDRFAHGPEPVGFDPSLIPGWTSPEADAFGGFRMSPTYLRVFPYTLMTDGTGDVLTWKA